MIHTSSKCNNIVYNKTILFSFTKSDVKKSIFENEENINKRKEEKNLQKRKS